MSGVLSEELMRLDFIADSTCSLLLYPGAAQHLKHGSHVYESCKVSSISTISSTAFVDAIDRFSQVTTTIDTSFILFISKSDGDESRTPHPWPFSRFLSQHLRQSARHGKPRIGVILSVIPNTPSMHHTRMILDDRHRAGVGQGTFREAYGKDNGGIIHSAGREGRGTKT